MKQILFLIPLFLILFSCSNSRIEELEEELEETQTELENANQTIIEINESINSLDSEITTLKNEVDNLLLYQWTDKASNVRSATKNVEEAFNKLKTTAEE